MSTKVLESSVVPNWGLCGIIAYKNGMYRIQKKGICKSESQNNCLCLLQHSIAFMANFRHAKPNCRMHGFGKTLESDQVPNINGEIRNSLSANSDERSTLDWLLTLS